MKKILACCLLTLTTAAIAQDPRNLISVDTDGFGLSGLAGSVKFDEEKTGIKDGTAGGGRLSLNYGYIFEGGFMLGIEAESETENSEVKVSSGEKIKTESSTATVALMLGYNFNSDLNSSWWVKGTFGSMSEKSKLTDGTDPTNDTSSTSTGSVMGFELGKRISLKSWGLKNVTYSPSIEYASVTFSGDKKDSGTEGLSGTQLNLIKIDVLF
jgi:Outer membrane protein beta-barrel domain